MRVSFVNLLIISAALGFSLVLSLLAVRVARWRRDVALRRHDAPVLVVPLTRMPSSTAVVRPPASHEVFPPRNSPSVRAGTAEHRASLPDEQEPDVIMVDDDSRPTRPMRAVGSASNGDAGSIVEGSRVLFFRAEDGTLEFLPGRLEIVGGEDIGQEIHFARQVGEDDATVTFGRSEGPPLRHVQLLDPTVSRVHARMMFDGRRWHLRNMSRTNPVMLNGAPLPDHGSGITLAEGDRLEMGAVVFRFHDR